MGSLHPPGAAGDRELWLRASDGDTAAFGELFSRHASAVYNHLFRRAADWSEAEDLTSAVFLQAWRRRGRVVIDRESALPWLLGVAPSHLSANADTGGVTLLVPAAAGYAVTTSADVGSVSVTVQRDPSSGHVIQAFADVGSVTVAGT